MKWFYQILPSLDKNEMPHMSFLKLKLNNIVELSLGCMLSPKATSINDVTTNYQYLDTLSLLATPVISAK